MIRTDAQHGAVPRVEYLKVQNFRALKYVELRGLTPMTVLLGPNGSGKSTLFDVFAFLSECFQVGLRRAWDRRGRARELKTRDADGPVVIELKYREGPQERLIGYRVEIDEDAGAPVVAHEWLQWKRKKRGKPFRFLEYRRGSGDAIGGERPDRDDERREIPLKAPDLLAVNALGQFQEHPRVAALRDFIVGWHVSYLSADNARGQPEAGPQERLTATGDNLANVIQYLSERRPERLEKIFAVLRERVPRIDRVHADAMPDGRLLLRIKDAPFTQPVLARFTSDGTIKMLAYLVLLHDTEPPPFIGIEEPENFLHPRLLREIAEECMKASERTQLLVTTHSPFFLDALQPKDVRILWRDGSGHTQTRWAVELDEVNALMNEGALLGDLWMEGHFGAGDPLTRHGAPKREPKGERR